LQFTHSSLFHCTDLLVGIFVVVKAARQQYHGRFQEEHGEGGNLRMQVGILNRFSPSFLLSFFDVHGGRKLKRRKSGLDIGVRR
jgi:hypothetical protein